MSPTRQGQQARKADQPRRTQQTPWPDIKDVLEIQVDLATERLHAALLHRSEADAHTAAGYLKEAAEEILSMTAGGRPRFGKKS